MKNRYLNAKKARFVCLSSLAIAAVAASPTRAQEAQDPEDSGEIIVTAQKRAQNTLDVGINVSVVGEDEIASRRIESVTDVVVMTPNVSIKENIPGLVPVLTIRGVGLNDFSATNNPSAGVYVDEVFLSSLALMNFDFFDLERMEVLKGPQGTLYGRNSTAGALNVVTGKPKLDRVEGRIAGSIGNYETKDVEGMINLPLGEAAALRVAAKGIFQDKGFWFNRRINRDIGRRDVLLGRVQLLVKPSDAVDMVFKFEGQRGRSELGSPEFFGRNQTVPPTPGITCPGDPRCLNVLGYRDPDTDPFRGDWSVRPDFDVDQISLSAKIDVDLGFATLTSVTGYIDFDRQWGVDVDASPARITDFYTDDRVEQFSQELRIAGETDSFNWLVGGFYSRDTVFTSYDGDLQDLFRTTTFTSSDQLTKSAAIFANGEWKLGDTIDLITGVRYTHESRSNTGGTSDLVSVSPGSFLTGAPFGSPPIRLSFVDQTIRDNNFSWKLGLNWKPSSATLIYASASQGVKSGGFFAGVSTRTAQLIPYKPEKLIAYEIGLKNRVSSIGLSTNVSAFYYDYSNIQTFIRDVIGAIPVQRLGNVRKAEIYGVDADLVLNPRGLSGLTVTAGLGLLHAELGEFASGSGPVPAGNKLPDAPNFSFNGSAAYQFSLGGDIDARLAIDGRYQSKTFKEALNEELLATPGYWVWNARLSVLREGDWDVSLWGKNLGDKRYVTQSLNQLALSGSGNRVYGPPRTWGVSVSKQFR